MSFQKNIGWVYCMSNPSIPGLLKVGMTERTPEIRARELFTTGVPTPFKIEFAKKVLNPLQKEKTIHKLLLKKRTNPNREFFSVSLEIVKDLFNLMDGEIWEGEIIHQKKQKQIKIKKNKKQIKKRSFDFLHLAKLKSAKDLAKAKAEAAKAQAKLAVMFAKAKAKADKDQAKADKDQAKAAKAEAKAAKAAKAQEKEQIKADELKQMEDAGWNIVVKQYGENSKNFGNSYIRYNGPSWIQGQKVFCSFKTARKAFQQNL